MSATNVKNYRLTKHAVERAAERGFTKDAIMAVLANPELVYASRDRGNQERLCGRGMVIVVDHDNRSIPTIHFHGR